jgi:lantibiotic modifying enzyme
MTVSTDARLRQQLAGSPDSVARPRDARDTQALADGFRNGWGRVRESRAELEALVRECESTTVRVLLRSTREYAELLVQASMPPYCHDVLDRSLLFERVRRALGAVPPSDMRWAIADREVEALVRGDIPHFSTAGGALAVHEAGDERARAVRLEGTGPVRRALQNLRRLDRQQRLHNEELITSALESSAWPDVTVRHGRSKGCRAAKTGWAGRHAAALGLFDAVRRRAYVDARDRSIAVVAATLDASGRAQQLGVADPADTYSGLAGLGLLAGALVAVRETRRLRDTAVRVADTLSVALESQVARGIADRCGAFAGSAGIAYAVSLIGDLLGESLYSDFARRSLWTWAQLSGPVTDHADVVSGAAGVCHVAAALRGSGNIAGEDMTSLIGPRVERLVALASSDARGLCSWPPTEHAGRSSGFAHGSAGIGAALARVVDRDPADAEGREVMRGALRMELQAFDSAVTGWRHEGGGVGGSGAAAGWCYGGAGMIVASHAFERQGLKDASVLADRGVESIINETPLADGLCHGLAGSSAVLAWHGSEVGDRQLAHVASRRLCTLAGRCLSGDDVGLEPTSSIVHSAGLMCGSTGIALALVSPELDHIAARLLRVA